MDKKTPKITRTDDGLYVGYVDGGTISGESEERVAQAVADYERRQRREAARRDRWGTDNRTMMARLCRSFPSLAGVPGSDPWDANAFLQWASGPGPGSGAFHAAMFVLSVWNPSTDWSFIAREQARPQTAGAGTGWYAVRMRRSRAQENEVSYVDHGSGRVADPSFQTRAPARHLSRRADARLWPRRGPRGGGDAA